MNFAIVQVIKAICSALVTGRSLAGNRASAISGYLRWLRSSQRLEERRTMMQPLGVTYEECSYGRCSDLVQPMFYLACITIYQLLLRKCLSKAVTACHCTNDLIKLYIYYAWNVRQHRDRALAQEISVQKSSFRIFRNLQYTTHSGLNAWYIRFF